MNIEITSELLREAHAHAIEQAEKVSDAGTCNTDHPCLLYSKENLRAAKQAGLFSYRLKGRIHLTGGPGQGGKSTVYANSFMKYLKERGFEDGFVWYQMD